MYKTLEKIFILASVVPFIGVNLFPADFRYIGDIGWGFLLAILMVHPLVDIFPNVLFFKKLMPFRKPAGILCGSLLVAHVLAYFVSTTGLSLEAITDPTMWSISGSFLWGNIGILIIILLTLTSNLWSVIHLKKWWKRLHYLTYVAFIMGAIHLTLVVLYRENWEWNGQLSTTIYPILILVFIRLLAILGFKVNLPIKKDVVSNS